MLQSLTVFIGTLSLGSASTASDHIRDGGWFAGFPQIAYQAAAGMTAGGVSASASTMPAKVDQALKDMWSVKRLGSPVGAGVDKLTLLELHNRMVGGARSSADISAERDLNSALKTERSAIGNTAYLYAKCGGGVCETSFVDRHRDRNPNGGYRSGNVVQIAAKLCVRPLRVTSRVGSGRKFGFGEMMSLFCVRGA